MKKLAFYLLALTIVSFSSCSKDDDDNNFKDDLVGVWYVTSQVTVNCDDPADNETLTFDDNCDSGNCLVLEFTEDNEVTITIMDQGLSLTFNGTWDGDADDFELCILGDCDSGDMDIDGNNATLYAESEDGCQTTIEMVKE